MSFLPVQTTLKVNLQNLSKSFKIKTLQLLVKVSSPEIEKVISFSLFSNFFLLLGPSPDIIFPR